MGTLKGWLGRHPLRLRVLAGPYETRDEDNPRLLVDAYRLQFVWEDGAASRKSPEFAFRSGIGNRVMNRRTQREEPLKVPDVATVLDCLVSDAAAYDSACGWDDFAAELGYDPDSRKGHAVYEACGDTLKWLTALLGGRAEVDRLMYQTDRL